MASGSRLSERLERLRLLRPRALPQAPQRRGLCLSWGGRPIRAKVHGKEREHGSDSSNFRPDGAKLRSASGMKRPFIACNHGMQSGLAAVSVIETAYFTQQPGGPTRGVTLRPTQAAKPISCGL